MESIVILAGGLGTRLRSIVSDRPKSMAPINGMPFLEYQIQYFKNQAFNNFVICSGYKYQYIINYFNNSYDDSIKIVHSKEDEPLGTGGAIKKTSNLLTDQFFVINGDTITQIQLHKMLQFHMEKNADITIALARIENNSRYGSIITDEDNRVIDFVEKKENANYFINAGVYLINKNSIDWDSLPIKFSLEKDVFSTMIQSKRIFGYETKGYFVDIGIPTDFQRFKNEISSLTWLKEF